VRISHRSEPRRPSPVDGDGRYCRLMEDDGPYEIDVITRGGPSDIEAAQVRDAVRRALRRGGVGSARVSVALVDDAEITLLNKKYLHHSGPTDVLSFNLTDPWDETLEGELVLSTQTAWREAAARGHDPTAEMLLYAIHGALHLAGMDDAEPDDAARMHEIEDQILSEMRMGPAFAPKKS